MHILVSPVAYWASMSMLVCGVSFILFIELLAKVWKAAITVYTPGWRGLVPSLLLVGLCLSAVIAAFSVLISVWFNA